MKVVIDISERDYNLACKYPNALIATYAHYIKDGTVISDNHGDLIDREDARMCLTGEIPYDMTIDKYIAKTDTRLRGLSPVISANKETKNV